RVDENSLEAVPTVSLRTAGAPREDDRVRFVCAGGEHELRGVHVLFDAARRLAERHGDTDWTLTAYGVAPYVASRNLDLTGLPVFVADPYRPEDLPHVLHATDVLVLPSIMETYSLLA